MSLGLTLAFLWAGTITSSLVREEPNTGAVLFALFYLVYREINRAIQEVRK